VSKYKLKSHCASDRDQKPNLKLRLQLKRLLLPNNLQNLIRHYGKVKENKARGIERGKSKRKATNQKGKSGKSKSKICKSLRKNLKKNHAASDADLACFKF